MKLTELQATLKELDASPTKSLGQNFLHDRNLATWIVSQLDLKPGERWLEIGPGLGSLTSVAQEFSKNGLLIEKDDRLIAFLRDRYPDLPVIHGDACRFDTRDLLAGGPIKIFGNLPYYVSSQILFNFTTDASPATALLFTLQKELAERFAANPNCKDYGSPTVLIGRRWKVTVLRTLPGSVFLPVPKVDSSVVLLTPRPAGEFPDCDGARFSTLVKLGFSQRRKQLGKLLAPALPQWAEASAALGLPVTSRAESLSVRQWCELAAWTPNGCHLDPQDKAQDVHREVFDVVDAEDRVLRQESRFEVHRQKLCHRAVHIFLRNKAGEMFLQKRSRWKDVCPQRWDSSAAGHVNAGRDYEETALREVEEELGISAPVREVSKIAPCEDTGHEFVGLYEAEHEGPLTLPPSEIELGEWFTIDQIRNWTARRPEDFAPGFLKCWEIWTQARS
ncbi:MAG: 16S rRNA (adenine1518-N6/adenine1519-N6)-dimethyltransferase [Verrucomicrobia bacterium]|nr:MAG: 16S rRNA (adenine1518-N6/adenine1519-N6)-dimethyltransferase [Verrucomicrobiota bacterium]